MSKNENIESYLKKLQELESELDDSDPDPDMMMSEINKILTSLSKDVQVELKEHALQATLKFMNKSNNPDPEFAKDGDSGFDIRANLGQDCTIPEGQVRLITTGLYFEVQKGLEVQIRSRSGLAMKTNMMVLNSPGTLDSGYRGECMIILANFDDTPHTIRHGDRIAQGVVCPVYGEGNLNMIKVKELSNTERGTGGFGHTGVA